MSSALPPGHNQPAVWREHRQARCCLRGCEKVHLPLRLASRLLKAALTVGILTTSLGGAQAQPGGASGHQQIREAVQSFIEDFHGPSTTERRVEIVVSSIDPRLPIPACDLPLQTQLGQQSGQNQAAVGRVNVRVECQDSTPWSKYVPVLVRVFAPVLMSTRPLARGDVVGATDVELAEADLSTLRQSYLQDSTLAIGMEVKRALPANTVIGREALAPPLLVKRGDTVVMSAKSGTVTIRQQGVAMQNGELGAQIPVRNSNSDIVVRAVVTGPGQADVVF
ncbi:MAG: flagellar basal body P-ring formation chaperone FlgA [Gammaproteobacteria bacterium]|nr:flagellar basal body P-ring formation chaperone FlgA [Gammaproteobacteria bacterium]